MTSAVVWFEIHVTDVERSAAFYERVARWTFAPLDGMPAETYRQIANSPEGSVGGALVGGFPEGCGGGGTIVYIAVDDLTDAVERVVAGGGSRIGDEQLINDEAGSFVTVVDPDGNPLGLWTR